MSLTDNRPSPMVMIIFMDYRSRCGGSMKFRLVTKTAEIHFPFELRGNDRSHTRSSSHTPGQSHGKVAYRVYSSLAPEYVRARGTQFTSYPSSHVMINSLLR